MLLAGCATEVTREVDRVSIAEPAPAVETASYRSGAIGLGVGEGFWMTVEACGADTGQRICGTIRLDSGRRLQLPNPSVTLEDPVSGQRETLAIDTLAFDTRCTVIPARIDVPYTVRLQDDSCPSDSDDLRSVEGPVTMELLDQRVGASATLVFKRFTFAARLPFHGAGSGAGASFAAGQQARLYRFRSAAASHFRGGQDLVLSIPPVDLDGQAVSLPRLQLHRQTETSYQFRELM